jgi:hypothetical protein
LAEIPGVTIDWVSSPRIIYIPLAVRTVSAQDLVDTLRAIESELSSLDDVDPLIYEATGKTALDESGTVVGITVVLLNAQIYFVPDTTPISIGTATSNTTASGRAINLIDNTATFITDALTRGDTIYNNTTGAMATIISTISETELESVFLTGGSRDTWLIGDSWVAYNQQQCPIEGGNVVAIDDAVLQNLLSPVLESPNVQIVRSSSSSATLQELVEIQHSSYEGGVWISTTGVSGATYPIGTPANPVNNITDAVTIAVSRGFTNLKFIGNFTFLPGTIVSNYTFIGSGPSSTTLTFDNTITAYCKVQNAKVTGATLGLIGIADCHLVDFSGSGVVPSSQTVIVNSCIIEGEIGLPSNYTGTIYALDCWSVGSTTTAFNMNGGNFNVETLGLSGDIEIINCTHAGANVVIGLNSGTACIGSSNTAGNIKIQGVGDVVDAHSGTAIIDISGLAAVMAADKVWESITSLHETAGTMGSKVKTIADDVAFIKYIEGGRWKIDTSLNQMIFYKDDNVTEVARFNLKDSAGAAVSTDVFERVRA